MTGEVSGPGADRRGWAPVALLCLGATATAAVLRASGSDAYRFLIGGADPVAATLAISVTGVLALLTLSRTEWFFPTGGGRRALGAATLLGAGLTIPVLIVDGLGGFPADMNVPAPDSLLFYPSIALLAELVFHAIPLAVVALLSIPVSIAPHRMRLLGMLTAAIIEPVIQVLWGSGRSPVWANTYVGAHVLVFNLVAVYLFRRHGFLTVYLFRLAYYLVWHVAWGHVRLTLLFGG